MLVVNLPVNFIISVYFCECDGTAATGHFGESLCWRHVDYMLTLEAYENPLKIQI
jgi:hypothetical protein